MFGSDGAFRTEDGFGAIPSPSAIATMTADQLRDALEAVEEELSKIAKQILGMKYLALAPVKGKLSALSTQRDRLIQRGRPPADREVLALDAQIRSVSTGIVGPELVAQVETATKSAKIVRDAVLGRLGRYGVMVA